MYNLSKQMLCVGIPDLQNKMCIIHAPDLYDDLSIVKLQSCDDQSSASLSDFYIYNFNDAKKNCQNLSDIIAERILFYKASL